MAKGRNVAIDRAIDAIDDSAWTAVKYPAAERDPDTGGGISDAGVAEIGNTAFAATEDRFTARLVLRRVENARFRDALFQVWRYRLFSTNSDLPTAVAECRSPPARNHRIRVFTHLIDGSLGPHVVGVHTVVWGEALCAGRSSSCRRDGPGPTAERSCAYPVTGS